MGVGVPGLRPWTPALSPEEAARCARPSLGRGTLIASAGRIGRSVPRNLPAPQGAPSTGVGPCRVGAPCPAGRTHGRARSARPTEEISERATYGAGRDGEAASVVRAVLTVSLTGGVIAGVMSRRAVAPVGAGPRRPSITLCGQGALSADRDVRLDQHQALDEPRVLRGPGMARGRTRLAGLAAALTSPPAVGGTARAGTEGSGGPEQARRFTRPLRLRSEGVPQGAPFSLARRRSPSSSANSTGPLICARTNCRRWPTYATPARSSRTGTS